MVKESLRGAANVTIGQRRQIEARLNLTYSQDSHPEDPKAMAKEQQTAWTVASAKAHFSEVIDKATREGPQIVTRNGRPAAVLVSVEEWERRAARKGTLTEFFQNSPLRDSGIDLTRPDHPPRKAAL